MKFITRCVSRIAVLTGLAIALPAFPAFSDGVQLAVSSSTGIMYGMAKEFVLDGSFAISELDWPVQPVFFAETALDVKAFGGLHGNLKVQAGIPGYSGLMTDSDWANYPLNGDTSKTHFSQSNGFTERAVLIDAHLGWEFKASDWLSIEPFASFGYMSWQWAARDGYLQYPPEPYPGPYSPWSPSEQKVPVYGTGIVYQQTYLIPAAGLRLAFHFAQRWDISASVSFSPAVTASVLDTHVLRQIDISGSLSGGTMVEPGLDIRLMVSDRASLSLGATYRHISGLVGDEVVTYSGAGGTAGTQITAPGGYGASYDMLSAWLSFTIFL